MKITVFGANGPVGRILTAEALAAGHDVTVLTRHPEEFPIEGARLRIVGGDVLVPHDVESAVTGADAVVSLLGTPYRWGSIDVYSRGTGNMLRAMKARGVRRFVGVTSGGTRPGWSWKEGLIFGVVLKRIVGRTLYADMRKMEAMVQASDLEWTIVRPARLLDAPAVTAYAVAADYMVDSVGVTARADLASFLLRETTAPEWRKTAVAVASPALVR